MKKMKRMICLALSLMMLAALAACGAQPQPEQTAKPQQPAGEIKALAAPVYPTDRHWSEERLSGSDYFTEQSVSVMLAGLNGGNRVYSPLNIYMALGMLAEITDGESREQVLALLGSDNIEALRAEVKAIWESEYRDDELLTVLPAASVWLRDGEDYKQDALKHLAEDFYASAFSGPMGDESYNRALRDWVNERTNHLLEEQAEGLKMSSDTVIALLTTLYFKGAWSDEFSESATESETFHAEAGDKEADFMRGTRTMYYYRGERFGAVYLSMNGPAGMWLILPDEGTSLQELIDSGEAAAFLSGRSDWDREKYIVHLSLPKFDVSVDMSLIDALQAMGVKDVFDPNASDFSPLSDKQLMVSDAEHAARVIIDEKGCEAAAFTAIMVAEGAEWNPEEPPEMDFVLDRPFLFAVTGRDSVLFLGAISDPTAE